MLYTYTQKLIIELTDLMTLTNFNALLIHSLLIFALIQFKQENEKKKEQKIESLKGRKRNLSKKKNKRSQGRVRIT